MQFTAAVLTETNRPLTIVEKIEIPSLAMGQVLVKIHYSGVCHSQLMECRGMRGVDKYLPHMLGHEASGEVIDIGANVTKVRPGDRVVLGWLKGSGQDVGGVVYKSPIGKINAGSVATFNEYAVVSENRCYVMPKNLDMKTAVLFGCALPTGMGMVQNQLLYRPNSYVGVFGLGGIGISSLLAIIQNPPAEIVVFDTNEQKLQLAGHLGATILINTGQADWLAELDSKTDGRRLDYVIESAGSCRTIEAAFSALNPKGKCVFASHPPHGDTIQIDPFELICGKQIEGSWGGQADPEALIKQQASKGTHMPLSKLLSTPFGLRDINNALEALAKHKVVRSLVKMVHD